jgi:hypothetical protein
MEHRTKARCPDGVRTGHEQIFGPGQVAPVMRYSRIALRQLLPETSGSCSQTPSRPQLRHAPNSVTLSNSVTPTPSRQLRHANSVTPTPSRSTDRAGKCSSWSGASSRRCRDGRERDLVPNSRWNALARPNCYRSCPGLTRQSSVGPADVKTVPSLSPEQCAPVNENVRVVRTALLSSRGMSFG